MWVALPPRTIITRATLPQSTDFAALLSHRLKIVNASGLSDEGLREALATWSIDGAHCFDPNEELHLRRVLYRSGMVPSLTAFVHSLRTWQFS